MVSCLKSFEDKKEPHKKKTSCRQKYEAFGVKKKERKKGRKGIGRFDEKVSTRVGACRFEVFARLFSVGMMETSEIGGERNHPRHQGEKRDVDRRFVSLLLLKDSHISEPNFLKFKKLQHQGCHDTMHKDQWITEM